MAVIKRKIKKADLSALVNGRDIVDVDELLASAHEKGISTIPLDVEGLIRSLGVKVKYEPMSDDVSGHLELVGNGWEVAINSLHHPKRQRFTLAHELAHYILHRWKCQSFTDTTKLFRNSESSLEETEANQYAAKLLMPEKEFRHFVDNVSKKIDDIANHFDVSAYAVRIRAKNLGYSGHGV